MSKHTKPLLEVGDRVQVRIGHDTYETGRILTLATKGRPHKVELENGDIVDGYNNRTYSYPSPATIRQRALAIRKTWGPREKEERRITAGPKVYRFSGLRQVG